MKNYLTLVLAVAVVSSPAYASRARLEALGEGKNGSYYIDDARNMFLNPATIAKNKKKLMLELGGASEGPDSSSSSVAQGGFINTFGDFTYALYLNNNDDSAVASLGAVSGVTRPRNTIELALAGEGSVNWGLSVLHGGAQDSTTTGSNYWKARFGLDKDNMALFGTVGLYGQGNGATAQDKAKLSLNVGATYKMDSMTAFANFQSGSLESSVVSTGTILNTRKVTSFAIGAGWNKEMTKSTHMFTRVEADYAKTTNEGTLVGNTYTTTYNIPVVLGAEAQALSWLAIRGSLSHSLIGQDVSARTDLGGTTTAAAGLGMTFGDVTVDGLVATGSSTVYGGANQSFGFGDGMMSRIAMTYNF
jgi:hypothetical protein